MFSSPRKHTMTAVAGLAAFALLAACSGGAEAENPDPASSATDAPATDTTSDDPGNTEPAGDQVTVSITTFGTFGYDDLYTEYMEANPGVKIEANNIDTGGNARTDAFTKIAAGSGLADIVAIEEGWLGAIMEVSDRFEDLRDYGIEDRKDDWLDWKYDQATDPDGRVIGYGTDIGPTGLCYNGPAFADAGFPTDREEVAELFGGDNATWDRYFELGAEYHEKTGRAWYDHSGFVWNSIVNQMPEGYYKADGSLNVEGNAELEAAFTQLAEASLAGQTAGDAAWDWNGGKSFVDKNFATFVCPGWMLGVVEGNLEAGGGDAETGWDFADVFPGGAGNWGGSWLSISADSQVKEEAAKLADWLTQPEQQVKQAAAAGNFPSTIEAAETLAQEATPHPIFNDAPTGAILASRAEGVRAQYKGPEDSVIQENVFGPALNKIDRGETDAAGAWAEALKLLDELVD